jgi:tetratricopeptide (TPR) repeat protein
MMFLNSGEAPPALVGAEQALAAGESARARTRLAELDGTQLPDPLLRRFVDVMVQTNRFEGRHAESLDWIEKRLLAPHSPEAHAVLLRARVECLRSLDTRRALDAADEALTAAEAVGDEVSYAVVLAHAAFAAYRRSEVREAARYATLASSRSFREPGATVMALRARMFAATAAGNYEQALDLSIEVRDRTLALGDLAQAANESNNIAESQLQLGRPLSAIEAATRAAGLAQRAGFATVERFARVLVGVAMAENGQLDAGVALLRREDVGVGSQVLQTDTQAALSFWMVERDAEGDAAEALRVSDAAITRARTVGLHHFLTTLLCTKARAQFRLTDERGARTSLEQARSAFDAGDVLSERHLAIAMGEILAPGDVARRTALGHARAHLLRDAGKRDDALAYCTGVRIHRRLLEMTGGVPLDLPRGR